MTTEIAKEFVQLLDQSRYAVVFTGAGSSTGSGIPDFRGKNGLYSRIPPETFDIDLFKRDPSIYYNIEKSVLSDALNAQPNSTHLLIARLEKMGKIKGVITQNIDGLHQKAGSSKVIELHGTMSSGTCLSCGGSYSRKEIDDRLSMSDVPRCSCGGVIKVDVVFFGEMLPEAALKEGFRMAAKADLMIVMGSSLTVYPAASIPRLTAIQGGKLLIINKGETALDRLAYRKYEVDLVEFCSEVFRLL